MVSSKSNRRPKYKFYLDLVIVFNFFKYNKLQIKNLDKNLIEVEQ